MEKNNREEWLRLLFEKDEWSEDDRRQLLAYLDDHNDEDLRSQMEERFHDDIGAPHTNKDTEQRLLHLIHGRIKPTASKPRVFTITPWKKWAVAAALLLVAGKLVFDATRHPSQPKQTPSTPVVAVANDRPAGTQNATLTLGDGTKITLDSAANGNLAQQGNTKVIKLNGQIAYSSNGRSAANETLWNTISTARGNQYMLILSDGTKVWLNAASSMRFPTAFKGSERKVEITGEAYFEIAKDAQMPFKVIAGGGEIQVLGTHFNVNAYTDESAIKTTLLEGSVAVQKDNNRLVLAPGQQARFHSPASSSTPGAPGGRSAITLLKDIDTGHETAWKDGFFWFDNTDIHTLIRQVSRWYDVEIEIKGEISDDGFTGKVPRSVPLSRLLKVLELNDIHSKIEGNHITITP